MNRRTQIALLAVVLLAGCGQSGQLYLPDQHAPKKTIFGNSKKDQSKPAPVPAPAPGDAAPPAQ
jgi:predicted small lipoprotein YifL